MRPRRAGYDQSRHGCLTCKVRRVKCDETTPHCRRCTESGRKCEGPVVCQFHFVHNQASSVLEGPISRLQLPPFVPPRKEDERRAFHYFTHCAIPLLVGAVDASFWKVLVPQLAQTYSFVWDTVVCISSLLEHVPYRSLPTVTDSTVLIKVTNRQHRQALRFYNRAMANVRQLLAALAQVDDSVIALSYILFASIEFQQKNVKIGNDLVRKCCQILSKDLTSRPVTSHRSTAGENIYQVITPFVMRRAITIVTLGDGPSSPQCLPSNNDEGDVEDHNQIKAVLFRLPALNDARVQFQILAFDCYEIIRLADVAPNIRDDDPEKVLFMTQRVSLLEKMARWKSSFLEISNQTPGTESSWISSYLLMYWAVCYISLAVCISNHQTTYDDYMDYFAEIVEHATTYLSHHSKPTAGGQLFPRIDPGVVPPLYFCGTKCRHPILRRKALCLVRQATRQESHWAFVTPDVVLAKVISIEEGQGLLSSSSSSSSSSPQRSPELQSATNFPPEERRLAYVNVVGRCTATGKQRQALELCRYDFSTDGSSALINNYTWLDDE